MAKALNVCRKLKEEEINAEVINARFLKPFDKYTVLKSINKTHFVVTIEDNSLVGGLGAEVKELIAERPEIETFGENLGVLTSEIFGYEVTNSGFHTMIQNSVEKYTNFKRAMNYSHGKLGNEGKAILRSLMYEKEQLEEDGDD